MWGDKTRVDKVMIHDTMKIFQNIFTYAIHSDDLNGFRIVSWTMKRKNRWLNRLCSQYQYISCACFIPISRMSMPTIRNSHISNK